MRVLLLLTLFAGASMADQLLFRLHESSSSNEDHVVCPDRNSKCSKEATCCQMANGQWGCCPFPRASCCSDKVHCCPQGYSCNAKKGQCVKAINNDTIPWAEKNQLPLSSSSESSSPTNSITCADGTICAGTSACCRTYAGTFRCCAYPNDVCCSDGFTCCPRCTICDIVNRRCVTGFATEEWKPLMQSTPSENPVQIDE